MDHTRRKPRRRPLDADVVYANCRAVRQGDGGREIDDATARVIASWYAESADHHRFVTTGAFDDPEELWRSLTEQGRLHWSTTADDRLALDMLGTYLLKRADRGPVPGWNELWVP